MDQTERVRALATQIVKMLGGKDTREALAALALVCGGLLYHNWDPEKLDEAISQFQVTVREAAHTFQQGEGGVQ